MPLRRQPGRKRITPFALILILLLAFSLQTNYLVELRRAFPHSFTSEPFCGVDAKAHAQRAGEILDGSLPGENTFYFIPFYPYYLAILKGFLGDSFLLPIYIQALWQLVGIAALYGMGRLAFSPLTGVLAALGLATYSYYLYYVPCFDQALFTVPFLTLGVFFLLKYHLHPKAGWLLIAGIALAGATLSRPTILATYPVILLWLVWRRSSPGQVARNIFLLVLPFMVFVSPITWHNYRVSGRFILLSDNFGVNLFTGNNPDASGLDSLAHVQSQPAVLHFEELNPRVEKGQTTLTAEVLRYISEQPGDWLALTARKTWLWFGEIDERLVSPFFPLTVDQSRTLAPLPLEWQAMAIVAVLGLLLASRESRSWQRLILLWLVYGTLSLATILFFIQLRFRLPLAPFVLLSAASLLAAAPRWKRQHPRRFWVTLIILLLLYPMVSTLWIFILLFAGLGLWPGEWRMAKRRSGEAENDSSFILHPSSFILCLSALCLYLLAVGLWIRTNAANVSQSIDHYLGPPLAATGILGQTFQMDCDGLHRIEVTLGVFDAQHDQSVTFYLATDISAQEILFSETFDGSSVKDYQKKSFSFPPIPDSAGRAFFFYIASPTSTPQNAITARGYADTPVDRYPAGSAWAGQPGSLRRLQADFAFGAYCQMNLAQKLGGILTKPFVTGPID